ncbi:protease Do [Ahniella affigens]|uniref:Probable periplasmic serine endoprotease DegP-like n=1 Tax=Ahniella affigens TaxID=2021234 RepID=A0A2P1PSJ4_9GAMM|nr:DegQ family serine endoprotease [Ahniella affigens]AVP97805.1 protease Do [Ahniella affigens]
MRLTGIFATLLFGLAGFASQAQTLPDFTGLVERTSPAVVNIESIASGSSASSGRLGQEEIPEPFRRFFDDPRLNQQPQDRVSGGSGFIISADGYLITNHHVVDEADEVRVTLKDRREFKAKVIGSDQQSDVALLKIDATGLPTVALGDSDRVKPGQWAVAIGSPFGLSYTVTAGVVSAVGRNLNQEQRYVPFIQNDLAINRGNSGGPLFNLDGQVIGINSQIFSQTGGSVGISFAIPINYANQIVAQLKSKGRVARGYIGVSLQRVTAEDAKALGLPRVAGALVAQVNTGTPGAKAGLKLGDVIQTYNGTAIEDSGDLPPLVGSTAPGTRASLGVFRDGKQINVPVVIAELPADAGPNGASAGDEPVEPGSSKQTRLGLVISSLNADERESLGLDANEGVLIKEVTGTAARRAGLQPNDVVLMVNRQKVGSIADFSKIVQAAKAGSPVMLLIRRGENNAFVTYTPDADAE